MHWILWIIALILSAGAGYWVYKTDKTRAVPYPLLTASLRSMVIFLTGLLLLAPSFTITRNSIRKPVILLLQDDSRSVSVALGNDSARYRKDVQELAARLSARYRVVQWGFGNRIQTDSLFSYRQEATDISTALIKAQDYWGRQNLGAIVLASDGRYNEGANPLLQSLSIPGTLYSVALGDSAVQKDIRITRTYANSTVSVNSQFEIRAGIVALLCNGYNNNVQLTEGGSVLATARVNITSDRYDKAVSFMIKAAKAGLHHYTISVPVAEGERNLNNNRKDLFVEVVDEKKNILILSNAPHPDVNAIKEALAGMENYAVTVRTADNVPASLSNYQAIILHQLPSLSNNLVKLLQSAKKPAWYILGPQTNVQALSELQRVVKLNINPAVFQDAMPAYNRAFTAFTLPQTLEAVLDKMPPLAVPAGTFQVGPNAFVLFSQRQNAKQPLWILEQGTTPLAMLMGEGLWRWRLYEYKNFSNHEVIDECIRQTVAFLVTNNHDRPFSVTIPKHIWSDQESVSLNAYLLNANNEQVNTADAGFTITDTSGHKQSFTFERSGNCYKLNLGVWAAGTYTYTAAATYNGKQYNVAGSFVIESTPLELMETGADYPLLYGLAKKYNGSLVAGNKIGSLYDTIVNNSNIKPVIQINSETVPLVDWKWYFFLILAIAVSEWLLRKYWLAQ